MVRDRRELLRARSAAVFGNRYLAEIVTTAAGLPPADQHRITVRLLATRTGLGDNLIRPVVKRLVDADLLRSRRSERPRGPRYHQVRNTSTWRALVHTCNTLGSR